MSVERGNGSGAALPGTYEAVRDLLAELPPGRILDAPCGEGHLAASLDEAGHRVIAADLLPQRMAQAGIPTVGLDLNSPLPFRDGTFDAVLSIEGIEHLENPYLPAREFFRVLRPGGILILSTPNILNLRSRMKFLVRGTLYWFDEWTYRRGFHVNAIPVYELHHILTQAGFGVDAIRVNRRPLLLRAAAALVGPLLRLAARDGGRPESPNAPDLLAGEVLLVRARKGSGA